MNSASKIDKSRKIGKHVEESHWCLICYADRNI